ncbi:LOW QUALITY PROTEIN: hypothetical protein TorRG33x02_298820, partial [Trema orientale]
YRLKTTNTEKEKKRKRKSKSNLDRQSPSKPRRRHNCRSSLPPDQIPAKPNIALPKIFFAVTRSERLKLCRINQSNF